MKRLIEWLHDNLVHHWTRSTCDMCLDRENEV